MRRPSREPWLGWARAALPFVLAALAGAGLARLTQPVPPAPLVIQFIATPSLAPTPTLTLPPPEPTPPPATPTAVVLPADALALRVVQLELAQRQANGNLLLLQAASRFQSARIALRDNQPDEVLRQLAVAQEELDVAAELVPEQFKGPVQDLNLRVNYVRDDLAARPELIESQLLSLWETATSLMTIPPP